MSPVSRRAHTLLFGAAIVAATCLVGAQAPALQPVQTAPLSQAIPVDPQITVGRYPNGLRYYVRANPKPEKRAELRLVVRAGSVLEDDDQQGLAHFVEHMAFNGTRHFPKQDVIAFMQSLGMQFGAHVNAYTSFDETVYTLTVPTDRPEMLDRALLILEDWAQHVTFDPVEIEKERGVIIEEWRLRRGAGARVLDKQFPILLQGSRYADRLPIGKTEIIQNFKPERLKQFYTDWYRPDLMAVIAVGDFDKPSVERMIAAHFSTLRGPAAPRRRPIYDIPDRTGTVYAITPDREATSTTVEIQSLLPAREQGTIGVYREKIVDRLFSGMLSARLSDMAQKPDAPFIAAGAGRSVFFARTREEASLAALVREDGIARGLEALLAEAERVSRFGFTQTEIDRQRQATLAAYERMLTERDNRESESRADEYIRNFMEQETLPTIADEHAMHARFLPQITLDEVNRRAREWFPDRNRIVLVTAPEKPGLVIPDRAALSAIVDAAASKTLTAYVDAVGNQPLIDGPPPPGRIVKTSTVDTAGITEWELSNGVRVVLKPTAFKEDEILFRATSPGGTSLASDPDYVPASTATQLLSAGGLGKFSAVDLRKVLSGKVASARPSIGEFDEGLSGSSSRRDLETMFQLIYLSFTQPRADATAFGVQAAQARALLANQSAVPEFAFVEALTSALSQNHPRRRLTTADTVDKWNLDRSLAFYKDRFADASDFTFVFVGSFEPAGIKPLVERYLGALPSIRRRETWKDTGVRPPTGVVERKVEKGIEPKSLNAIVFTGPFVNDSMRRVTLRGLANVLQAQLVDAIREELGGTYSITASQSVQRLPTPQYTIGIEFTCDPERADALVKRVFQEIDKVKANGPSEQQVNDIKLSLLREFETSSKDNGYLLNQITTRYQHGEEVTGVWAAPDEYRKLTAAAIREAARTYLDTSNYVKVTLMPAKR